MQTSYFKIARYAFYRAHKATTPERRTFWFDVFDVAAGLADALEPHERPTLH